MQKRLKRRENKILTKKSSKKIAAKRSLQSDCELFDFL